MRVNEDIFKSLYCLDNGSPNASIRVLVGMMILKEGQGWSDEQLFEQCQYNLLVRSALGLMNLTDTVPSASTYYLFRKRIAEYNRENEVDLFKMYLLAKPFEKDDNGEYRILKSVFEQQFILTPEETILPREKEKISAQSIQSPNDPDCHYRNKEGNKVKGYSINLTETCHSAESKDNSSKERNVTRRRKRIYGESCKGSP